MTRLMSSFGDVGWMGDFSETCNEVFDLRGESLCKKRRANMRRKGGDKDKERAEGEVYCQLMACGGLNLL